MRISDLFSFYKRKFFKSFIILRKYDRLYYEPDVHERIANLSGAWERTITVGSGGKTFGTTGWRIGWLIGPKHLIGAALSAQTRIVFCVNTPLQVF